MSDNVVFHVLPDVTAQPFFCPNCRSRNCRGFAFVDPPWTFGVGRPSNSPWDYVLQRCFCGDCSATIPAHLAERWEGRTEEDAIHEWKNVFRDRANDGSPAAAVAIGAWPHTEHYADPDRRDENQSPPSLFEWSENS
jgi:hypothetical protein